MKMNVTVLLMTAWVCLVSPLQMNAAEDFDAMIFRALNDEMNRSLSELKLGDLERPYHIEYILTRRNRIGTHSVLGITQDVDTSESASLTVKVRVGEPKFDNTNFFDVSLGFFGSSDDEEGFKNRRLPIELSYNMLRRELWLATDACYKQSVELFAKKKSAVMNRARTDPTWDFKPIPPGEFYDEKYATLRTSIPNMQETCNALSMVFRDFPDVVASKVGMEFVPETIYYLSSDGRKSKKIECFTGIEVVAIAQADDGMPAFNTYAAYGISPSKLPSADSLLHAVKDLARSISAEIHAASIEAYSGPVIFEGQAAGEVIAQVFAPNLVSQRQPLSEGGFSAGERNLAFQNKIGARVLPEFLSVFDTPSKRYFSGNEVAGYYELDDEAVQAKDVQLVDNGYLKTLLSSRTPTKRVQQSNGHQRGGGAMFSVVEVQCTDNKKQLTDKALKQKLMKLVKDRDLQYGIIVRKAMNQNLLATGLYPIAASGMIQMRGENKLGALEVFRVFPDGREEQIRGVEIAGVTPPTFKDILAVGKQQHLHNLLASSVSPSFMSGGSQYVIASIITPDLLFEDVEIRPIEGDLPKPPIMTSPLVHTSDK
ncbi:MAG: hypothetical protein HQ472_07350 [Ignavibacteria bacterium]|nr:hypothetical protein [Ignavibacteria bacterium]